MTLGVMFESSPLRVANVMLVGLERDWKGLFPLVSAGCGAMMLISYYLVHNNDCGHHWSTLDYYTDSVDMLLITMRTPLTHSWLLRRHRQRALDNHADTVNMLLTIMWTLSMRSWLPHGHHWGALDYHPEYFIGICFVVDDGQNLWMLITCCSCIV